MRNTVRTTRKDPRRLIREFAGDRQPQTGNNGTSEICQKFELLYDTLDELIALTEYQNGDSPQLNLDYKYDGLIPPHPTVHYLLCAVCDLFGDIAEKLRDGTIQYKGEQYNESIAHRVAESVMRKLRRM